MERPRLDPGLVSKIAKKAGIKEKSVREMVSAQAGKLGVTSVAALVVWARNLGIGTTGVFNKLSPELQAQVRGAVPVADLLAGAAAARKHAASRGRARKASSPSERTSMKAVVPFVLSDPDLRKRCGDLLTAPGNFDRVLREATTILEARLRQLANLPKKKAPKAADMVNRALNPNPDKALLRVSEDSSEQEGFHALVKGVFFVFRNDSHHLLSDKQTRWDALRLCGFVDYLLGEIATAEKAPSSTT